MRLVAIIGLTMCGCSAQLSEEGVLPSVVPDTSPAGVTREYSGIVTLGNGEEFTPDEMLTDAAAQQAQSAALVLTLGWMVRADKSVLAPLRQAVDQGRRAGIPSYGMNLRVRLVGTPVDLSEPQSGFERELMVARVVEATVCPRRPAILQGSAIRVRFHSLWTSGAPKDARASFPARAISSTY